MQIQEINRARVETEISLQVARDGADLARAQKALKQGLKEAEKVDQIDKTKFKF